MCAEEDICGFFIRGLCVSVCNATCVCAICSNAFVYLLSIVFSFDLPLASSHYASTGV